MQKKLMNSCRVGSNFLLNPTLNTSPKPSPPNELSLSIHVNCLASLGHNYKEDITCMSYTASCKVTLFNMAN